MIRIRGWTARLAATAGVVTVAAVLLTVVQRVEPARRGLRASYFANTTFSPPEAASTIDPGPSTSHVVAAWGGAPPGRFSAVWTGWLAVIRDGTYTFATVSDDASAMWLDGRKLVDNGGTHSAQLARGSTRLTRGFHAVMIQYVQDGGDLTLDWLWARDGSALAPVPAWLLRPGPTTPVRFALRAGFDATVAASQWLAVGLLLLCAAATAAPALEAWLARESDWRALRWIVLGSVVLDVTAVWWGWPSFWALDEIKPQVLLGGLGRWFAHGWFDKYPPLHFWLLSGAASPVLLLDALGRIDIHRTAGFMLLCATFRLVSVAAAAGVVIAAGICGTRVFGRRAGLLGAGVFALVAPFVYYAKTANVDVPYMFWWALSMLFFLRLLDRGRLKDHVLFSLCGVCAICTKDQAYGLFVFTPLAIIWALRREHARAGDPHPLAAALADRRLAADALTTVAVFAVAENLVFNVSGFTSHLRYLLGPGSHGYQMFDATASGEWHLLELTVRLTEISLGWPLFVTGIAGMLLAIWDRERRPAAIWLLISPASYYVAFVAVILFDYDRFVLPICWVMALFGGLALDALLRSASRTRVLQAAATGAVSLIFAYSLLYAGSVDASMIRDSRYAVRTWLAAHVSPTELVGTSGPLDVLPLLDGFAWTDIRTPADLETSRPRYYVLNADYTKAVPPASPWGHIIAGLRDGARGYRLVLRCRSRVPWDWLPGAHPELLGRRDDPLASSILRNVNPTIEVFQRADE